MPSTTVRLVKHAQIKAEQTGCTVYAPSRGATFRGPSGENPILTELFPLMLQHESVVDSMIAFTLCMLIDCRRPNSPGAIEMWQRRGKALRLLRDRLNSPVHCSDDASIHTVISLMAVDVSDLSQVRIRLLTATVANW